MIKILKEDAQYKYLYRAISPVICKVEEGGSLFRDDYEALGHVEELSTAVESEMKAMGSKGLAEYLSDYHKNIYGKIESIKVKLRVRDDKVVAHTIIASNEQLNDITLKELKEYITGQFSDGWGEGFEQRAIDDFDYEIEDEYYDEEEEEFVTDSYTETGYVYYSFWSSDSDWYINIEEV